jgi:Na+/H+-dicarboxylate symporter
MTLLSAMMLLLPVVIFGLLFNVAVSLARDATRIILIIVVGICLSNYTAVFISHYVGEVVYGFPLSLMAPENTHALSLPTWYQVFPQYISNRYAMIAGIVLGIGAMFMAPQWAEKCSRQLERITKQILRAFTLFIPFFVGGLVLRLQHEGSLGVLFHDYSKIVGVVLFFQLVYVGSMYLIACRFRLHKAFRSIRNMLPAVITGFSAMSSAAAMPFTIMASEKNVSDPHIARSVIPATVNAHLLGDCLGIPIFAYAILKSFGMPEPTLMAYAVFAFYFMIAKFSAAGVPGGGVVVILPVLAVYLGFTPEMTSLMFSIYLLFDSIMTGMNVLANGAFAMMVDRVMSYTKSG